MEKIDLRIDVSRAAGLPGQHEVAMTAWLP